MTMKYDPEKLTIEEMLQLGAQRVSVEVDTFQGHDWHKQIRQIKDKKRAHFPCFVVTKNSEEFPQKFAVRLFDGGQPTCLVVVKDSLKAVRRSIPNDCPHGFPRHKSDNKVVVETWM